VSRRRGEIAALARLDALEVLRSRWPVVTAVVYGAVALLFTFGAMRESSVLGFTGTGRVVLGFTHALVLLVPLLALAATAPTLNRAREDGSLELLLGHPVSPAGYFAAVTLVRLALLLAPLALLLVGLPLATRLAFGDPLPWQAIARTLAVSATLVWAFVGVGMALSAWVAQSAKAAILALLVWATTVALLDFALIGVMLQWRLQPAPLFLLATVNPVQCARLALLAGQTPELDAFGPIGFFLAQELGSGGLLALGLGWPAAVGTLSWLAARRRFRTGDFV
jgi:ABC-type transport system involved in multi-copper enzyme maturation permease subunit